ncbi:MAG: Sel1 repeat-containing protein [Gallionellaceae bacterium]|nr:MAG: Sel1 repeat-containing protein [Gallionellaceae bacterium]
MGIFINSSDFASIKALAEQGDAHAQYVLGYAMSCSAETEEGCEIAMSWCRKAAAQGHPVGLWKVGGMYEGVDPEQAADWYRKSAEAGYRVAQWWLGVKHQRGEGVGQNHELALHWFRKAAAQGEATACNALGEMYETGKHVGQDWQQSAHWYRRAAEAYSTDLQNMASHLDDASAAMNPGTYRLPLHDRTRLGKM